MTIIIKHLDQIVSRQNLANLFNAVTKLRKDHDPRVLVLACLKVMHDNLLQLFELGMAVCVHRKWFRGGKKKQTTEGKTEIYFAYSQTWHCQCPAQPIPRRLKWTGNNLSLAKKKQIILNIEHKPSSSPLPSSIGSLSTPSPPAAPAPSAALSATAAAPPPRLPLVLSLSSTSRIRLDTPSFCSKSDCLMINRKKGSVSVRENEKQNHPKKTKKNKQKNKKNTHRSCTAKLGLQRTMKRRKAVFGQFFVAVSKWYECCKCSFNGSAQTCKKKKIKWKFSKQKLKPPMLVKWNTHETLFWGFRRHASRADMTENCDSLDVSWKKKWCVKRRE